jgi:hypothetical protein
LKIKKITSTLSNQLEKNSNIFKNLQKIQIKPPKNSSSSPLNLQPQPSKSPSSTAT